MDITKLIYLDAPILSDRVYFFLSEMFGDDINAIFCRGFYSMTGEEEAW